MKLRVKETSSGKYRAQYKGWLFWNDCYGRAISYCPGYMSFIPAFYPTIADAKRACFEYKTEKELSAKRPKTNKIVWKNY